MPAFRIPPIHFRTENEHSDFEIQNRPGPIIFQESSGSSAQSSRNSSVDTPTQSLLPNQAGARPPYAPCLSQRSASTSAPNNPGASPESVLPGSAYVDARNTRGQRQPCAVEEIRDRVSPAGWAHAAETETLRRARFGEPSAQVQYLCFEFGAYSPSAAPAKACQPLS